MSQSIKRISIVSVILFSIISLFVFVQHEMMMMKKDVKEGKHNILYFKKKLIITKIYYITLIFNKIILRLKQFLLKIRRLINYHQKVKLLLLHIFIYN